MAKKKKKSQNPLGVITSLGTFAKEARQELAKVSWPNRQTTVRYTIIVIIASLATGGVIGGVDYIFSQVLEQVI